MKKLYQFTLKQKATEKVTEKKKDKDGKDIEVTKDVEKEVDRHVILRKPTRSLFDEAELYYCVKLAEGIKAGLLTRALLEKRFENDGGTRSDEENKEYNQVVEKIQKFHKEQSKILEVDEKKRTPTQKKRLKELENEIKPARRDLRDLQLVEDSLYEETAESRARNKVILWWMLHLAYSEDNGTENPFFGNGDLDSRF